MKTSVIMLLGALLLSVSCGLQENAGSFSMSFKWETPPKGELYIWTRVEERIQGATSGPTLASTGPDLFIYSEPFEVTMGQVANGDDRVVVVEAREGASTGLPVLYYGISNPFSLAPGSHSKVEVPMSLQSPETDEIKASVRLEFEEGPLDTINITQLEFAHIITQSVGAVGVVIANDASFTANLTTYELGTEHFPCEKQESEGTTWDVCTSPEWDLLAGLTTDADGLYTVFVKFLDQNGYESQVYKDSVVYDTQPPLVIAASATPEVVAGGATLSVTVSFHEELNPDVKLLHLQVEPEGGNLSLLEVEPSQVGTSNSYLWQVQVPKLEEDDGNIYTFSVQAVDSSGNESEAQTLVDAQEEPMEVRLDSLAPAIENPEEITFNYDLFPIPSDGSDKNELTFDFVLQERNPVPMEESSGPCELCPEVLLSGNAMGTVTRRVDIDDPGLWLYAFSYHYQLDDSAWEGTEHKVLITIRWVDLAGNMAQETLPRSVTFDFLRPDALKCTLEPENANGGEIISYQILASEPLGSPPEAVVDFGPEGLFDFEPLGQESTWQWDQEASDLKDGKFKVSARLVDLAGNESGGTVCEVTGSVDSTPPVNAEQIPIYVSPTLIGIADENLPDKNLLQFEFGFVESTPPPSLSNEGGVCQGTCPVVRVGGKELGTVFREPYVDEQGEDVVGFAFEYQVHQDDWGGIESDVGIEITWVDAAGNEVQYQVPWVVTLDFVAPGVYNSFIEPELANANSNLVLKITASEPLSGPPILNPPSWCPDCFNVEPEPSENLMTYTWQQSAAELPAGSHPIGITVFDPAGNSQGEDIDIVSFTIDNEPPVITQPLLTTVPEVLDGIGETRLAAGPQDKLLVQFSVEEDMAIAPGYPLVFLDVPGDPVELLSTTEPDEGGPSEFYEYQLVFGYPQHAAAEGYWPVRVEVRDTAGNVTVDDTLGDTLVRVDFTAPEADCSLVPTSSAAGYGIDQKVTLYVTPLEELEASGIPELFETITPDPGAPFFYYEEGSAYRFSGTVADWKTVGEISVRVELTDLVGNTTVTGQDACTQAPTANFDTIPPSIAGGPEGIYLSKSRIKEDEQFHAAFSLTDNEILQSEPVVMVGNRSMTSANELTNEEYGFSYTPDLDKELPDEEGIWPLSVLIADGAGNETVYSPGMVYFDFAAPGLSGTPGLQFGPPDGCPLPSVDGVTRGTSLTLFFAVDEILHEIPLVWAEGGGIDEILSLTPVGNPVPDQFSFNYLLGAAETMSLPLDMEVPVTIKAQVTDLAGNQSILTVVDQLPVDTVSPGDPDVTTPGAIVYTRIPWGSKATGGAKGWFLRGGTGAVEAGTQIRVYDGSDIGNAMFLGQTEMAEDGSFGALPGEVGAFALVPADLAHVYIEVIDSTCNSSISDGALAPAVLDGEWVATMGYKSAGSTTANPHEFRTRQVFEKNLWRIHENEEEHAANLGTAGMQGVTTTGSNHWQLVATESEEPTMRTYAAYAYDSARGVTVMFGGTGLEGLLSDTWEYNGITWRQVEPADPQMDGNPGPAENVKLTMAFDSRRGKSVLFNGDSGKTWEWDGESWALRIPVDPEEDGAPAAGMLTCPMVWDPVQEVSVMIQTVNPNLLIWQWDGVSWELVEEVDTSDPANPPFRILYSLGYDGQSKRIFLFGGRMSQTWFADTWAWDGQKWEELTPVNPVSEQPSGRVGAVMAYDAENGQLVMFGGGGSNVNWGSSNFFIWNGSEWEPSSLSIIGHDPAFPLFVWDSRRARPVAFGGTTNWPFSDFSPVTFEWHSGFCTYRDFTPEDTTPPNQRKGQLAAYPDRKVLTLFLPANDSSDRTWEWSLSGWSRPEPDTSPPKHNDSSLVYDGNEGGRILLFGGHNWVASEYDDLWAWDGEDWEELSPLGSTPPACFGAAMAWDSNRNRVVMSCGGDLITSNDFVLSGGGTWEFDGSSWNQSDLTGPGGDPEGDGNPADRVFGTMVHDQSNGVTMLLNGLYPGDETEQWHDHWEFDGTSWARQESLLWPDADLLPANYAASPYFSEKGISWKGWYDPYAKDVVVMGQDGNSHYIEPYVEPLEAWRWDGETWHHLPDPADPEGDGEPAPRMGYYMDFFAPAGLPLLFGGRIDQSVWTDDTWYWNRGLGQRPGHVLRVNLIESGVEDASSYTGLEMTWHAGGTGTMDEEEIHGTRLSIWHAGTFIEKVSNEAPAEAPESLVWSTDDPLVLTGLPVGANLVVGAAVTPAGANWYEYATLSSSYAEVKLSYH